MPSGPSFQPRLGNPVVTYARAAKPAAMHYAIAT